LVKLTSCSVTDAPPPPPPLLKEKDWDLVYKEGPGK
jgi:hypothetical protein